MKGERKLIVGAAVERRPVTRLRVPPPLLEEEGHPLCAALTTDLDDPFPEHWPSVRAALTADDDPVDSAQVERPEIGQQRLDGEEPDSGWCFLQRKNAGQAVPAVLNADAEGHVVEIAHPSQLTAQQFSESLVPFGEDLKHVPVSPAHDVADAPDVVGWNLFMKEVAHRVDKDLPRPSPMQRLIELLRNESKIEPLLERVPRPISEAFGEHLCVTKLASGANLGASADGVPRGVRPPMAERSLMRLV